ncbi:uncharacterized protein LOC110806995 [Carica papaya]|uniref:uncharacterized protein LOC110806995 n=1 Tax=Carica papaya TaxID=3649 RepID=UPI000B8D181B|nr:uncharacterized protein LOC110806995 [Carica papaya]
MISPVRPTSLVASLPSSVPDGNGHRNSRIRDDTPATTDVIRDRKVRISDGASLYALCRSWLKNGVHEEIQPQYGDGLKSLPRPLPAHVADDNLPIKKEREEEESEEEGEVSVDHLSTEDLLKRHIKRAKKVRARLREERLKRIARYKSRLALLLPPFVEQCRNDYV